MNYIELCFERPEAEMKKLEGRVLDDSLVSTVVEDEDTTVVTPGGDVHAVFLKGAIPQGTYETAYPFLLKAVSSSVIGGFRGTTDYRNFRISVFDRMSDPAVHFEGIEDETERVVKELMALPAYQDLARSDGDCGAAMLAERSVAVPFVSAFVGALAVTQAIRIASGEGHHSSSTGNIGDLRSVRATVGRPAERVNLASISVHS